MLRKHKSPLQAELMETGWGGGSPWLGSHWKPKEIPWSQNITLWGWAAMGEEEGRGRAAAKGRRKSFFEEGREDTAGF